MRRPLMTALVAVCLTSLALPGQSATPVGWGWRFDTPPTAANATPWRFDEMPPGFHLTTEASGVSLLPNGAGFATRRNAEARIVLFPGTSQEGYGITVAGTATNTRWLGFLIRRSGEFAVVSRDAGRETAITPWSRHSAIVIPDTSGYATNVLRLEITATEMTFLVNGAVISTQPRPASGGNQETGLRVGAHTNMHVTSFDLITPMATAVPRKGGG